MGDSEEVVESVDAWIDMVGRTVFVVGAVTVMLRIDAALTLVVLLPLTVIVTAHGRGADRALPPGDAGGQRRGDRILGEVFGAPRPCAGRGDAPPCGTCMSWASAGAPGSARPQLLRAAGGLQLERGAPGHRGSLLLAGSAMRGGDFTVGDFALFVTYLDLGDVLPMEIARWLTGYRPASRRPAWRLVPGSSAASLAQPTPLPFSGPVPAPPAERVG